MRRSRRRNVTVTDPRIIREVLARDDLSIDAASTEFGFSRYAVRDWRQRRTHAEASGDTWPTDADITAWVTTKRARAHARVTRLQWLLHRSDDPGPRLVDATGTGRRIRALAALGWRYRDIADILGVNVPRVGHMAVDRYPTVHRDTAAGVARVYDELSMVLGPSARTRSYAAHRRWPPPLAWNDDEIDDPQARPTTGAALQKREGIAFDEVAVERASRGYPTRLRPVERAEAVARLTARGLSARQIADRLGTTARTVQRKRAAS